MDAFTQADAANAEGAKRAQLEQLQRQRRARRAAEPLPAGGLFDETARDQRELFEAPAAAPVGAALTPEQIMQLPGFEEAVSRYLTPPAREQITSWSALALYLRRTQPTNGREQFRVLYLDKKNQLIADAVEGEGTVDHAPVYPREIARRCLELGACAVILTHNHPSGDPTPSTADVEMTRQIVAAL